MSEDATLDDFFETADEATEGNEPERDRSRDASVVPFDPTFRWTPGGEPCDDCGRTVERRWTREVDANGERDEERAFVCRECKRW